MPLAFEVGDRMTWHGHGGEAHGKDGEGSGVHFRASSDDPRSSLKEGDGARVTHREDALSPT